MEGRAVRAGVADDILLVNIIIQALWQSKISP